MSANEDAKKSSASGADVLIAPKPIAEYTPEEYHAYVCGMYELRQKGRAPKKPAPGLSVTRTKKGQLSIRLSKTRAFPYVTSTEIAALAKSLGTNQSDVWNAFRKRDFIIAKDRAEAEHIHTQLSEIPF